MKKTLLYTLSLGLTLLFLSCATNSPWTTEQRKTMRRALHEYRDMVYLDEMSNIDFVVFTDNVMDVVEEDYPNYETIVAMPNVDDVVEEYVTTEIIEQLDADGSNIEHIYPYHQLKKEGILPTDMSRKQRRAYYKKVAREINKKYSNFTEFFNAVAANTTNKSQINQILTECAAEFKK